MRRVVDAVPLEGVAHAAPEYPGLVRALPLSEVVNFVVLDQQPAGAERRRLAARRADAAASDVEDLAILDARVLA